MENIIYANHMLLKLPRTQSPPQLRRLSYDSTQYLVFRWFNQCPRTLSYQNVETTPRVKVFINNTSNIKENTLLFYFIYVINDRFFGQEGVHTV